MTLQLIDLTKMTPGPLLRDELPEDVLNKLRESYRLVGHITASSFEEYELSFLRDADPNSEADVWLAIGRAFDEYCKRWKVTDRSTQKEVATVLTTGSMGEPIPNKRLRKVYRKHCKEIGIPDVTYVSVYPTAS